VKIQPNIQYFPGSSRNKARSEQKLVIMYPNQLVTVDFHYLVGKSRINVSISLPQRLTVAG